MKALLRDLIARLNEPHRLRDRDLLTVLVLCALLGFLVLWLAT